jgi:hypothetical protein
VPIESELHGIRSRFVLDELARRDSIVASLRNWPRSRIKQVVAWLGITALVPVMS